MTVACGGGTGDGVRLSTACMTGGVLLRRYCDGEAGIPAFLDDYAFIAQAALDLFEASGNPRVFEASNAMARAFGAL